MFACKICSYTTDIKCNYKKHLQTAKHLFAISINNDTLNDKSINNEPKMSQNEPKMSQNEPKMSQKRAKNEPKKNKQ